ncbi:hypothetical protein J8J40_32700, partial [Mycobacterium tuberculosis]|nr:hypothetical protein [Mycobacterium tuberculosis]
TLSGAGHNTLTITNVETIVGNASTNVITLGSQVTGSTIDLGGGLDSLTLGAFNNTLTILNVETINAGVSSDVVTLGNAITGA